MRIKDIVNRDIVNLSNCEHEPIHVPGSIQPHGFMFAFNAESREMIFCSANTPEYIGYEPKQLLGKKFEEIFGSEKRETLKKFVDNNEIGLFSPIAIELEGRNFQCLIHKNVDDVYITEFEPDQTDHEKLANVYTQTAQFVSYLNNTTGLRELCEQVAKGTRAITGYDRVMVYRFDKEYNGEVFAESCRDDLEPFLGLHYPHTDIPPQARELYMRNLLRLIADINYRPVPIFTIDDGRDTNLDLSLSTLRSTSPIHVEYLQNMGVGATLTISLIHRGRLWGLIACHHYSPKNISPEIRLAAQLQGQFITSQIDIRQSNEEYEISRKVNIALAKLNAMNLPPVLESFKVMSATPEIMHVCNATGISIQINGQVFKNGIAPANDRDIAMLAEIMSKLTNDGSFVTDKLINYAPELKLVCNHVAGIIYHALGNGNSIIWYRPETIAEINWAGDPEKAIIKDHKGLHPRNSFNLWKQIVKCRSKDWLQPEITAAANYANTLSKQINFFVLSLEEERYRSLTDTLREANAELENINWISTHDIQEPLRKIQVISSRLISQRDKWEKINLLGEIEKINLSAGRMQILLNDILRYSRIKTADQEFEEVDLNLILTEVKSELHEIISESSAVIESHDLPVVQGISFLLKQLFSNIIQNSIKYAREGLPPKIEITAFMDDFTGSVKCHVIRISDNGIGFESQYSDVIFNIFRRLHGQLEYHGSGIGLALCRKIMQTHGGTITASGNPGQGAVFSLHFPCRISGD